MKQEIDQALFAAQFVQNPWYPVAEPSDAQASADMADASRDLTAKLVKTGAGYAGNQGGRGFPRKLL